MDDTIVYIELRQSDGPVSPGDLATRTPLTELRVNQSLQRMTRLGLVRQDAEGLWEIALS
jgi:DNA-binding IclR family transcriptional regulator